MRMTEMLHEYCLARCRQKQAIYDMCHERQHLGAPEGTKATSF